MCCVHFCDYKNVQVKRRRRTRNLALVAMPANISGTQRKSRLIILSYNLPKSRYECLCKPEAKDQFRPCHEHFRRQSFEKARNSFVFHHPAHDLETTFDILKILVLDPCFDDV